MMKEQFLENIHSILEDGMVENCKLENINILKDIMDDKNIQNYLYENFEKNFSLDFEEDDLFMKTQDLVYRVDYLVNKYLINICGIKDEVTLKSIMQTLIKKDIDLYSSVAYDDSDKEILVEYSSALEEGDISI